MFIKNKTIMESIAVVIPCYKRIGTLKELVDSLRRAYYGNDKVSLVFSIDYSGSDAVKRYAESVDWPFGTKKTICHSKNIGLRANILSCGDLTSNYDAVIVIEDDLEVAPSFYQFAKQAAEFYDNDDRIGGISIYQYYYEELTRNPFYPIYEGYDGHFVQWASSWGQLWTKNQWSRFRDWYSDDKDISRVNIPQQVINWKRSWKKYYIAYLVETDRYFIFPYQSYIYNGNKAGGEHTITTYRSLVSAPLNTHIKQTFSFQKLDNTIYHYDAYFQMKIDPLLIDGKEYDAELDLFGVKPRFEKDYVITSRPCHQIVYSFAADMIPLELNILQQRNGSFFFLVRSTDIKDMKMMPKSYLVLKSPTIWKEDLRIGFRKLFNSILQKCKIETSI